MITERLPQELTVEPGPAAGVAPKKCGPGPSVKDLTDAYHAATKGFLVQSAAGGIHFTGCSTLAGFVEINGQRCAVRVEVLGPVATRPERHQPGNFRSA